MNKHLSVNKKPFLAAGVLLGIGLGGFLDGILFHQVLQLHSMLSARLPQDNVVNIKTSMFWDGLFHALTWVTTSTGIAILWHTGNNGFTGSGKLLWGALLLGWGIFNSVEGVIDHHILGIHHVVETLGVSIYDYLFLASGILFFVGRLVLIRDDKKPAFKEPHYKVPAK